METDNRRKRSCQHRRIRFFSSMTADASTTTVAVRLSDEWTIWQISTVWTAKNASCFVTNLQ